MKKLFTYVIMLYASLSVSVAQQIQYPEPVLNPESCTSIMVGKKASADGSVMTSHTCDSNYRTWMDIVPSARTITIRQPRSIPDVCIPNTRGNPGDDRKRNATRSAVYVSIPQHGLSLPEREATRHRGNNDHRPESPCQQERYVHDRGTSANRLATLHDRP